MKKTKMRSLSPLLSYFLLLHTSSKYVFLPPREAFNPCYTSTVPHKDTLDLNLVCYTLVCLNRNLKLSVEFCIKPLPFPHQVIILFFSAADAFHFLSNTHAGGCVASSEV